MSKPAAYALNLEKLPTPSFALANAQDQYDTYTFSAYVHGLVNNSTFQKLNIVLVLSGHPYTVRCAKHTISIEFISIIRNTILWKYQNRLNPT